MILGTKFKRPIDRLDYDIDCEDWMAAGDSLADAQSQVTDGDVIVEPPEILDFTLKVWVEGGTDGVTSTIDVRFTTADGRIKEVTFKIRVKDY